MSSIATSSPATSSATEVLVGVPPILAIGFVEIALGRTALPEPGVHAVASSAGLVVGTWLLGRSHTRDVRRQHAGQAPPQHSDDATSRGSHRTAEVSDSPLSATVAPSVATKTLLTVLAAFTFWMLDVITSLIGYGTLFFESGDLLYRPVTNDWNDDAFRMAAPRGTVLLFLFAIPVVVFFARRLRSAAQVGLPIAIGIYGVGIFASNLYMERRAGGEMVTSLTWAWMFAGVLALLVACAIGRRLAARTGNRLGRIC